MNDAQCIVVYFKKFWSLLFIGYGEFFLTAKTPVRLVVIIFYLTFGMIIVGIWFTLVKEQMRKV